MSETIFKHSFSTAAIMAGFSVLGTVLLVFTVMSTREPIAASEREAKKALLEQVLSADQHDNDLLLDTVAIPAGGDLGNRDETLAYRGRKGGQASAVILETTAPDGYSGDIKLLIGILADGEISGVRVLAHRETPGLGDYIEVQRSDWIKKNFDGQSLDKTKDAAWKVKKDGGSFDYMAGATITPRAVVKATYKALKYFAAHREELFAVSAQKEAGHE